MNVNKKIVNIIKRVKNIEGIHRVEVIKNVQDQDQDPIKIQAVMKKILINNLSFINNISKIDLVAF